MKLDIFRATILLVASTILLSAFFAWLYLVLTRATQGELMSIAYGAIFAVVSNISLRLVGQPKIPKELTKENYMDFFSQQFKALKRGLLASLFLAVLFAVMALYSESKLYFVGSAIGFSLALAVVWWIECKSRGTK